ncbi:hypothetical protein LC613_26170 [Nostoc sphaeroides CHAB 2801]|uniref:hypothetical protein n=1 Tax=Nostoc sphaeroides TaxID=446679 RepID=UPI001E6292A6|nr:hypothetical protein [Nostoc sphaeroides]MCC5631258.1 hypothetical protein [Nostoc sphaeroides CHAB 2801]
MPFIMQNLDLKTILTKLKALSPTNLQAAICLMLLAGSYGCVQKAQEKVEMKIGDVQPISSKGIYNVVGSTNLPESSKITVAAVRYLRPVSGQTEALLNSDTKINRSILARQIVEVKQGQWEAALNLWQVSPDGSFQEVWQANPAQIRLFPEGGVTFVAIFDPATQSEQPDNQNSQKLKLENQQLFKLEKLESKLIRFTNEGEKYLQVSQTLTVALPTGKTIPPRPQPEDLNGGWGNRYQIPPQSIASKSTLPPPIKNRQTDAYLTPSEFLR